MVRFCGEKAFLLPRCNVRYLGISGQIFQMLPHIPPLSIWRRTQRVIDGSLANRRRKLSVRKPPPAVGRRPSGATLGFHFQYYAISVQGEVRNLKLLVGVGLFAAWNAPNGHYNSELAKFPLKSNLLSH